jgi:hypothetical protein
MNTEKLLKNSIKIAAVALTSPATWTVAGGLYENAFQRILVQLAALVLVEGALMLGWWQLDNDRKAEMPQRVLYATLALVSYIALWSIAIAHGEGAAGITFRLTLGVLLGYSVFESGILANIKLRRSADRNIESHYTVKRYRRKRAITHARKEIDAEFKIASAELAVNTEMARETLRFTRERRLKGLTLDHESALSDLIGSARPSGNGHPAPAIPAEVDEPVVSVAPQELASLSDLEVREGIVTAFEDDPKYVRSHLAKELGVSKTKLYDVINELIDEGVLDRRGQRINVVRPLEAVSASNGRSKK